MASAERAAAVAPALAREAALLRARVFLRLYRNAAAANELEPLQRPPDAEERATTRAIGGRR